MRKPVTERIWDSAGWMMVAASVLLAIIAWSPSLRFAFGSPTGTSERGAPKDFALPSLDGRTWSLDAHRGQVVLVNFWATWCPPCRMETPSLVALKTEYKSRPFEIVGINMDDDQGKVAPFVKEYGINYPVLLPSGPLTFAGDVSALPTTILLDRQGRVARQYVGMISERAVRADIEQLLAERGSR